MIYFQLFIEFCKVGLFTVGGGLAALPLLYDIAENFNWFTRTEVIDMIAISQSTPGPIGINMATFAGYNAAGISGALIASISTTIPAFFIVITIAKMLRKFQESPLVQGAFYGLRPAVAALIVAPPGTSSASPSSIRPSPSLRWPTSLTSQPFFSSSPSTTYW